MKQRYRFRLYPHPHQQVALAKAFGCARVVWNDALAKSRELYAAGEKSSYPVLAKLCITQAKQTPERSWLSDPSNVVLQQSVRDLDQAFRNWWSSLKKKRKGRKLNAPRFKKRRGAQSIRFMSHVFRTGERTLTLSKIGSVPIKWSRGLPSEPSSVTIIRDASGRYFASFVCEVEPKPMPSAVNAAVGIDLGITQFASFSTGEQIEGPKPLKRNLRKLRRLQQALKRMDRTCIRTNPVTGRRQRGSHRYHHQQRRIAKVHARITDVRKDFLEKLSTQLIRENQTVVLEDLRVSGMIRNRRLARSIADAGWRKFRTMLESKAQMYGREVKVISTWEPTSQRCSACGELGGKKPLNIRAWTCLHCGAEHDRDINAAKNILAAGLAESPERGQTKRTAEPQRQPRVKSRAAGCEASTHLKEQAHSA